MNNAKVLYLDIETSPLLVYTFSLFKPMIGLDQIVEQPRVIAWSARWHGKKKAVTFMSEYHDGRLAMLQGLRDLMDEADVVIGYNSESFDVPWLQGEFLKEGLERPSPFQQIDLYRVNKKNLRLASGKLDYLAWTLLEQRKVKHQGFSLWAACIGPDGPEKDKAWRTMKKYAIQDTALLQPLYEALRPYVNSVNFALYADGGFACTGCGGYNLERRGYKRTTAGRFQRYACKDCGSWSSDSKRDMTTALRPLK